MGGIRASTIAYRRESSQDRPMSRRHFLQLMPLLGGPALLAGALSAACATTPVAAIPGRAAAPRRKIRAICFDLFTLFDPRSVVQAAKSVVSERAAELCEVWRVRQFEYSWLRVAANRYADFELVTDEALRFAAQATGLSLSDEARRTLVQAYVRLEPWPDARESLQAWKGAGLRLAPLANYSPSMLERLLDHAGFSSFFDARISTDAARTFKPDPRAYALGESRLGLAREEIAFAAFGGWDAVGAKWFGFPTFWVNRLGVPQEPLVAPDGTGPTLSELRDFVAAW
jgi:2-haloacid dehalogenase